MSKKRNIRNTAAWKKAQRKQKNNQSNIKAKINETFYIGDHKSHTLLEDYMAAVKKDLIARGLKDADYFMDNIDITIFYSRKGEIRFETSIGLLPPTDEPRGQDTVAIWEVVEAESGERHDPDEKTSYCIRQYGVSLPHGATHFDVEHIIWGHLAQLRTTMEVWDWFVKHPMKLSIRNGNKRYLCMRSDEQPQYS